MMRSACADNTPLSVVVPSASRASTLHLLLAALLKLDMLRHHASEIIVSHANAESLAESPHMASRVAEACNECSAAKIVHVNATSSNSRVGCAHRYLVGTQARNDVLLHLDDDLVPNNAVMRALTQSVCGEPGFPSYPLDAPRSMFYGTTPRLCAADGYRAYPTPPSWLFTRRYFVLTNVASMSRSLNNQFVEIFEQDYAALMHATHGEGCDLIFNDFATKRGSTPTALQKHLLTTSVRNLRVPNHQKALQGSARVAASKQAAFHGGYERKGDHYATRWQICRCLAANATGAALRSCVLDQTRLSEAARLWSSFKKNELTRSVPVDPAIVGAVRGVDKLGVQSRAPTNYSPTSPTTCTVGRRKVELMAPSGMALSLREPAVSDEALLQLQRNTRLQQLAGFPRVVLTRLDKANGTVQSVDPGASEALPLFAYNPSVLLRENGSRELFARLDAFTYCRVGHSEPLLNVFPPHAELPSHTAHLVDGTLMSILRCVEDPRAFELGGLAHLMFVRYAEKCGGKRGPPRVWVAVLQPKYREVQLRWPGMRKGMQKNWLPFVVGGKLHVSYSLCPHVVLRCELDGGVCRKVYETALANCNPSMRGGAPPVSMGGGIMLGVAHTTRNFTTSMKGGRLYAFYEHFLYLQSAKRPFDLLAISPAFRFAPEFGNRLDNLQFCSGLRLEPGGRTFTLSYGVGDCIGRVVSVKLDQALRVLADPIGGRESTVSNRESHSELLTAIPTGWLAAARARREAIRGWRSLTSARPRGGRENCLGEGYQPFDVAVPHPYGRPDAGLWAWDANVVGGEVRVTILSRTLCNAMRNRVNTSDHAWLAARMPPQFGNQYIARSDLITTFDRLLPWEDESRTGSGGHLPRGYSMSFECELYDATGALISVNRSAPQRFAIHPWSVRCPLPTNGVVPDTVSASLRLLPDGSLSPDQHPDTPTRRATTPRVRVCPSLASAASSAHNASGANREGGAVSPQRFLSMCATAGREALRGEMLAEWIAHHQTLGVEHIFLFNQGGDEVATIVEPWVRRGMVTVVQWPFLGCSRKASGRRVRYARMPAKWELRSFSRIEQWSALETCYQRFHTTTKWMLSLDLDEYLAPAVAGNKPREALAALLEDHDPPVDIVTLQVLRMLRCPAACVRGAPSQGSLFGCHNTPDEFFPFGQTKSVMRTSSVRRFRIHNVIEPPEGTLQRFAAPPAKVMILHFKGIGSVYESMHSYWLNRVLWDKDSANMTAQQANDEICDVVASRRAPISQRVYLRALKLRNSKPGSSEVTPLERGKIVASFIEPLLRLTSQSTPPISVGHGHQVPDLHNTRKAQPVWVPSSGQHNKSGDAIFSMAVGVRQAELNVFLGSLWQADYRDDVVLVRGSGQPQSSLHSQAAARLVTYLTDWDCPGKQGAAKTKAFRLCVSTALYGSATRDPRPPRQRALIRFEMYQSWLRHYSDRSRIYLLDFRDVYFQANPFASMPPAAAAPWLSLFAEHETVGGSAFNSRWIRSCYGDNALTKAITAAPIVCSGTTAGTVGALDAYIEVMLEQFDRTQCTLHGSDQGFHVYAIYNGLLQQRNVSVDVVPAGSGAVQNLAGLRPRRSTGTGEMIAHRLVSKTIVPVGGAFRVLNSDGSAAAVVHQFDRFPELSRWVRSRWSQG